MYHGTDDSSFSLENVNPSSRRFDLCLVRDERIAEMYATRYGQGFIVDLYVPRDMKVASQKEALELLGFGDEADFMTTSEIFHAIDTGLDTLEAAGFEAVEYKDQLPGDARIFTTLRVFVEGLVEVSSITEIAA